MTDHKPCDPADPCATAYDLASERNTLDGLLSETKDRLDAALAKALNQECRSEERGLAVVRTRWRHIPTAIAIAAGSVLAALGCLYEAVRWLAE